MRNKRRSSGRPPALDYAVFGLAALLAAIIAYQGVRRAFLRETPAPYRSSQQGETPSADLPPIERGVSEIPALKTGG